MAHILCIDDDEDISAYLEEALKIGGHTVDVAFNGQEGLKQIREKKYDLIICDRHMPIMDGIETVRAIRDDPALTSLKVLMFTSASMAKEVDEAMSAGADGYVLKPINFELLLSKIKNALGTG